jgi:hypothetical protein
MALTPQHAKVSHDDRQTASQAETLAAYCLHASTPPNHDSNQGRKFKRPDGEKKSLVKQLVDDSETYYWIEGLLFDS